MSTYDTLVHRRSETDSYGTLPYLCKTLGVMESSSEATETRSDDADRHTNDPPVPPYSVFALPRNRAAQSERIPVNQPIILGSSTVWI